MRNVSGPVLEVHVLDVILSCYCLTCQVKDAIDAAVRAMQPGNFKAFSNKQ